MLIITRPRIEDDPLQDEDDDMTGYRGYAKTPPASPHITPPASPLAGTPESGPFTVPPGYRLIRVSTSPVHLDSDSSECESNLDDSDTGGSHASKKRKHSDTNFSVVPLALPKKIRHRGRGPLESAFLYFFFSFEQRVKLLI